MNREFVDTLTTLKNIGIREDFGVTIAMQFK
jgi:hypothetical protein